MKANELRIGNILYNDKTVVQIDARSIFDIWNDEGLKNYKPLQINKDLLIRFGFEYKETDKADNLYANGIRVTIVTKGKNTGKIYVNIANSFTIDWIQYIHELQNLVFALFNKELLENK
jgi:hypothetical protein